MTFLLAALTAATLTTWEDLSREAAPAGDLTALVAAYTDDCRLAKHDLDRVRCVGAQAFLKKSLPGRRFIASVDGKQAVSISEYDARIKGVRLTIAGCLACDKPVEIGREKRFVTLKDPGQGRSLAASVDLEKSDLNLGGVPQTKEWLQKVKPHLRVEFVFQPKDAVWSQGGKRGVAFEAVGTRVVDDCTGEVIFSHPRSMGPAPAGRCGDGDDKAKAVAAAVDDDGGERLSSAAISEALKGVHVDLEGCLDQFRMPGTPMLSFVVGANGLPQTVVVEGSHAGTALAQCLVDVARHAQFPESGSARRFKYPVLRLQKR